MTSSFYLTLSLCTSAAIFIPILFFPSPILRWIRRKRYQYEVTFGLYMMTPTEKFVLNSFLFLTVSLVFLASLLYLPSHISTVTSRAFYYWSGGQAGTTFYNFTKNPIGAASDTFVHASEIIASNAQELASNAQVLATKGSDLAKDMISTVASGQSNSLNHQEHFATAGSN